MNSIGSSTVRICPFRSRVDLVDHRGERRRLARAGGTGDEHQTARLLRELGDHRRQVEVGERLDVERDLAHHDRDATALLEAVAAEAREVLDAEREVELVLHLEALLLVLGEHRVRELQRVLRLEDHLLPGRLDVPVDAELGAVARGDVQVGRAALDHLLEEDAEVDLGGGSGGGGGHSVTTEDGGRRTVTRSSRERPVPAW
jgi:hypothetical protein